MKNLITKLLIASSVVVASVLGIAMYRDAGEAARAPPSVPFTVFRNAVSNAANTRVITVHPDGYVAEFKDGTRPITTRCTVHAVCDKFISDEAALAPHGPEIVFEDAKTTWTGLFVSAMDPILKILLPIGILVFFLNRYQRQGFKGGTPIAERPKMRFEDVAGVDEAKEELREVLDFMRNPERFRHLNSKSPTGVLLIGPPGNGKTMMTKALAGEANCAFFSVGASQFVEMFVGVGAKRVRELFREARKHAPSIIFIDEIDAVGRERGSQVGSHGEQEQTLNELLVQIDGLESNAGVIVVGATNRAEMLDKALLRPGRFDRHVVVSHPDIRGREKILGVHSKKTPLEPGLALKDIARGTPGFSGADLANLVNEASIHAARRSSKIVARCDFEAAKDKIMMGAERRTLAMTDHEREIIAYHEAGHALASLKVPVSDPIHKATIVPRGRALGMVVRFPERDRVSMSKSRILGDLVVAMAGRAAEELIFGEDEVTTGASNDLENAAKLARSMVTEWGFSERLGPVFFGDTGTRDSWASGDTGRAIDEEVKAIADKALFQARAIVRDNIDALKRLAAALLDRETLTGDEIVSIVNQAAEAV